MEDVFSLKTKCFIDQYSEMTSGGKVSAIVIKIWVCTANIFTVSCDVILEFPASWIFLSADAELL